VVDVFVVQHVHEMEDGEEDVKFIGVYSDMKNAKDAVKRTVKLLGFKDSPNGFCIDKYLVDEDNWRDGYVTIKRR
jgi:hypothetical protein